MRQTASVSATFGKQHEVSLGLTAVKPSRTAPSFFPVAMILPTNHLFRSSSLFSSRSSRFGFEPFGPVGAAIVTQVSLSVPFFARR